MGLKQGLKFIIRCPVGVEQNSLHQPKEDKIIEKNITWTEMLDC